MYRSDARALQGVCGSSAHRTRQTGNSVGQNVHGSALSLEPNSTSAASNCGCVMETLVRFHCPHRGEGVFRASGDVLERAEHGRHDADELRELLSWFATNLAVPTRLVRTRSKGSYRRDPVAMCWFRESAPDFIRRAWSIARLERLRAHTQKHRSVAMECGEPAGRPRSLQARATRAGKSPAAPARLGRVRVNARQAALDSGGDAGLPRRNRDRNAGLLRLAPRSPAPPRRGVARVVQANAPRTGVCAGLRRWTR